MYMPNVHSKNSSDKLHWGDGLIYFIYLFLVSTKHKVDQCWLIAKKKKKKKNEEQKKKKYKKTHSNTDEK